MLKTNILLITALSLYCDLFAADVANWKFDEPSKNKVADTVNNLTAEKLSQDGNMFIVADNDVLSGHDNNGDGFASLVIEVEFMPDTLGQCQLVRKTIGNTEIGYQLSMKDDGCLVFSICHAQGKSGKVTSRRRVEPGKWHKVVAVWDGRYQFYNIQLQVDEYISWGSAPFCVRLTNTDSPLTIGGLYRAENNFGQFFSGRIASVKISHDRPAVLNAKGKADFEEIKQTGEHLRSQSGFVQSRFIYDNPPTPECHASTIVDLGGGKLAASWFGGTHEGHTDVGIWFSKYDGTDWSKPVCLVKPIGRNETAHLSMFNPVLFKHSNGTLMLFYKDGLLEDMESRLMTSNDDGLNWSNITYYEPYLHGPSKNKPIELNNGVILSAAAGYNMEISNDLGKSWKIVKVENPKNYFGVIQGTLLKYDKSIQAIFRTRENNMVQSWSLDNGISWTPLTTLPMPSNNSGLDAVTLKDGRQLMVYNHTEIPEGRWGGPRSPLNVAISGDGQNWQAALVLEDEPGEYSYPAVIQADDGLVHISYTWKRWRVKWAVIDPSKLELHPIVNEKWPLSDTK